MDWVIRICTAASYITMISYGSTLRDVRGLINFDINIKLVKITILLTIIVVVITACVFF